MNLQLQTTNNTIIGLTGPSGKGKSTMCKMFLKMYKCKEGSIYIDGVNIEELDPIYVRSNITYINQNAKLFDRKILENMLYGCSDEGVCRDKYATIMTYPKMKELFKGLDINQHDCGPLGEKLSGGQRQMVNIISGLINPCRILILDEPTNALDKALKLELLEIIKRFKTDKQSIIIITHDKDVYPLFDKHIEI
jgi:ATP-binding cassette subfamily C protein LapB